MEHQLWKAIVTILASLCKRVKPASFHFSDADIIQIWYWAVLHDRPVSWACQSRNWPPHLRKKSLPSNTTMSRRLRSRSVVALQKLLETQVIAPRDGTQCFWMIDGKPMMIGGCSGDRQAGYGRAAGCKAKGYKLHVIRGMDGSLAAWRVAPMQKDERVMAERMLKEASVQGYVLADGHYNSNKLHAICDQRGNLQLVTPRRAGKGLGHRQQTAGRLRSKAILENPFPAFGQGLMEKRDDIERALETSPTGEAGCLACLPGFADTDGCIATSKPSSSSTRSNDKPLQRLTSLDAKSSRARGDLAAVERSIEIRYGP